MPCCGLSELRTRLPWHLVVGGIGLLSLAFLVLFVAGVLLAWLPIGRGILRCQKEFLKALWQEAMRNPQASPARFGARASGMLLPRFPRAAAVVYRRPELPILAFASTAVAGVVVAIVLIARAF